MKEPKAGGTAADRPADPKAPKAKPFDVWLDRGLHQIYDDVANEPIPEELLKLIEDDRNK